MKNFRTVLAIGFVCALLALPAIADDRLTPNKSVNELTDLAGASVADGDFMLMFDLSANDWVKTSLEGFSEVTASINGLTASAAELNYNDIATLGTGAASKAVVLDGSANYTVSSGTQTFSTLGFTALTDGTTLAEIGRIADDSARVNAISADTSVTCATHGTGQLNYISAASGTTNVSVTLPAATGSGCGFYFGWMVAPNSASGQTGDVVQVTGDDSFNGVFWMAQDGGNTNVAFETSADTDKLTFTSTQGAAQAGPFIYVIDVATDKWQVGRNSLIGTGTEATPGATGQRS